MADFTKTITDTVVLFAGDPTSKWGIMIWGVDNWATTDNEIQGVGKNVPNSQGFSDQLVKAPSYVLSDSMVASSDLSRIELRDAAGYNKVFLGDTIDGGSQGSTTWSQSSAPSTSWSSASQPSTSWSQE